MGLFNLGKKKAEDTSVDAQQTAPTDAEAKMMVCEKCKKEMPLSGGNMVLGGSAFCCKECCPEEGNKDDGVCEFC